MQGKFRRALGRSLPVKAARRCLHIIRQFRHNTILQIVKSKPFQLAFLELLSDRKIEIIVPTGDHVIRCSTRDSIGRKVHFDGEWQRALLEHAIEHLSNRGKLTEKSVFVDIGANIGTQSVYANLSGAFQSVISVEPEPGNYQTLKFNLSENGFSDALAFNIAGGASSSVLKLNINDKSSGKHSFVVASNNQIEVPVEPLDRIVTLAQKNPADVALIWIDVEGFEPEVWKGLTRFAQRRCPIIMEFTPQFYGTQKTLDFILDIEASYRNFMTIDHGVFSDHPISSLRELEVQTDILLGF